MILTKDDTLRAGDIIHYFDTDYTLAVTNGLIGWPALVCENHGRGNRSYIERPDTIPPAERNCIAYGCECGTSHDCPDAITELESAEWSRLSGLIPKGKRGVYSICYLDCPDTNGFTIERGKTYKLVNTDPDAIPITPSLEFGVVNGNRTMTLKAGREYIAKGTYNSKGELVNTEIAPATYWQEYTDLYKKHAELAEAAIKDSARYDEQRAAWMREREELLKSLSSIAGEKFSLDLKFYDGASAVLMRKVARNTIERVNAPDDDTAYRRYLRGDDPDPRE